MQLGTILFGGDRHFFPENIHIVFFSQICFTELYNIVYTTVFALVLWSQRISPLPLLKESRAAMAATVGCMFSMRRVFITRVMRIK